MAKNTRKSRSPARPGTKRADVTAFECALAAVEAHERPDGYPGLTTTTRQRASESQIESFAASYSPEWRHTKLRLFKMMLEDRERLVATFGDEARGACRDPASFVYQNITNGLLAAAASEFCQYAEDLPRARSWTRKMTPSARLPVVASFCSVVWVTFCLAPSHGNSQSAPVHDAHACFISPRPVDIQVDRVGQSTFECRSVASIDAEEDAVDEASMRRLRRLHRSMFGPWSNGFSSRIDWCAAGDGGEPRGQFARVTRDLVMGTGDLPVDVFSEGEVLRLARAAADRWITSSGREVRRDAVVEVLFPATSRFIDASTCAPQACAWTRYPDVRLVDARGRSRGRVADAFSAISVAAFDEQTVQLTNGLRVPRSNVILATRRREVGEVDGPSRRVELDAQEGVVALVEDGELRRIAPFDLRLFGLSPEGVTGGTCHVELGVDLKAWWSRECSCIEHADRCLSDRRSEQYAWVVHASGASGANVFLAAPVFGTDPRPTGRPVAVLEPADAASVFEWIGPTLEQDALSVRVASESAIEADVLVTYPCEHPWW